MLWIWASVALAEPPALEVEIVKTEYREGKVQVAFPGREGEAVKCDGWALGPLPVDTMLVEGVHTFEVTGKEPFSITTELAFEGDDMLVLDLSKAVAIDVDAPTGIRVISTSSSTRRLDGSVVADTDEPQAPVLDAVKPEAPGPDASETSPKPGDGDDSATP